MKKHWKTAPAAPPTTFGDSSGVTSVFGAVPEGLGAAFSGTTGEGKNFPAGFKMDRGAAGCREELLAVDMGGSAAGCRVVRDASVNEKIPCLPAMLHTKFTIFFLSITLLSSLC